MWDDVEIEQITPVKQEGTRFDKNLFDNMQAYIKSTDRYTVAQKTIKNLDMEYKRDFFPKTWTKIGEGQYQSGKVIITHDAEWDYGGNLAFDGNSSTYAGEKRSNNSFSKTLHIDYGEEIKITEFYISISIYIDTGNIKLQASKDNSTWVDIKSYGEVTVSENIVVANPDWYRYYRIMSTNGYNYYSLTELQTVRAVIHEAQVLELPLLIDKYEANKLVNIITPENFDETAQSVYININNLGNRLIKSKLKANSKYTLLDDGEGFTATPIEIDTNTKSVSLEVTNSSGGTATKNIEFYVGDASFFAVSLWGTCSYSIGSISAFLLIDVAHQLIFFSIGNKRVIQYENTQAASGNIVENTTATPTQIGVSFSNSTYLANYSNTDTYGRTDSASIYVSNITLSNGILKIPTSLYTNSRVGKETATVSALVNVIK